MKKFSILCDGVMGVNLWSLIVLIWLRKGWKEALLAGGVWLQCPVEPEQGDIFLQLSDDSQQNSPGITKAQLLLDLAQLWPLVT